MACSRNARNLSSELHRISGFGVRPAWYSRRNSANTRSRYSAAKLTTSTSMPITSATLITSIRSWRDEQYSSLSSSSQFFMNRPITFQPCRLSSKAATDESTPPDKPTTTVPLDIGPSPFLPCIQRQNHRRLAIIHKPAIDHKMVLAPVFCHHRRPMGRENQCEITHCRLLHPMPAQIASHREQLKQPRRRGGMINAIHASRHALIGVISRPVSADIRLFPRPAVQAPDRLGEHFALAFSVDRRPKQTPDFTQLPLGIHHICLSQAAIAMANAQALVGHHRQAEAQEKIGRA